MKKKYLQIAGVVILLIGVGWAAYEVRSQRASLRMHPRVGNVIESVYGLGTVMADRIFRVRGGISLLIGKLFVREGEEVRVGDPLVRLDQSTIRSRIDGTVTEVSFKEGEVIPAQVPIITVTNLQNLYLEVNLEQQYVLRLKPAQKVIISFESLRNEIVHGVVQSVFPKANQFLVRIDLPHWPKGVLPGMTADTAILVGEKDNVLLIPIRSISGGKVARIRNGKKEKVPVKLGVIDGEWAEVISNNLSLEDELVTKQE